MASNVFHSSGYSFRVHIPAPGLELAEAEAWAEKDLKERIKVKDSGPSVVDGYIKVDAPRKDVLENAWDYWAKQFRIEVIKTVVSGIILGIGCVVALTGTGKKITAAILAYSGAGLAACWGVAYVVGMVAALAFFCVGINNTKRALHELDFWDNKHAEFLCYENTDLPTRIAKARGALFKIYQENREIGNLNAVVGHLITDQEADLLVDRLIQNNKSRSSCTEDQLRSFYRQSNRMNENPETERTSMLTQLLWEAKRRS